MGLYLLNISVDTADPHPAYIPENLAYNDQESIIELVIEKVFGFENAIEEYDDQDTEDHTDGGAIKICYVLYTGVKHELTAFWGFEKPKHPDFDSRISGGFYQLDSPPPKV